MHDIAPALPMITPLLVVRDAPGAVDFYVRALGAAEVAPFINERPGEGICPFLYGVRAAGRLFEAERSGRSTGKTEALTLVQRFEMNREREKGFEPSTSTLARWHSTTELLPQMPETA
jgi:hypothetical protein